MPESISPIEDIKDRIDIVELVKNYVELTKAGNNYKACCPFHQEKTPSFFVSADKQMFKCFGCGEGGDVFSFVQKIEGLEFRDALRLLADKAGIQLTRQDPKLYSAKARLFEVCKLAAKFFHQQLQSKIGQAVMNYLVQERGLTPATVTQFQLGFAPESWRSLSDFLIGHDYTIVEIVQAGLASQKVATTGRMTYYDRFRGRIMFPISDVQGNIVGFTGRLLTEKIAEQFDITIPQDVGKYINSPETLIYHKSRVLYGLDKAKNAIRQMGQAILVEGNMDVILAQQAGSENAVAASGTALAEDQLKILGRYTKNLVFAFDADIAGQLATRRSLELALANNFEIKILDLADQKDPADLIKADLASWQTAVAQSQPILDFYFQKTFVDFNHQDVSQKKQAAASLLPWIRRLSNKIEQAHWLQKLGQRLGVTEDILRQAMLGLPRVVARVGATQSTGQPLEIISQQNKLINGLLGLLILRPQLLADWQDNQIFQEISRQYFDESAKTILSALANLDTKEEIKSYLDLKDTLNSKLFKQMEKLAFEAECQYLAEENFDCQTEINFCVNSLSQRYYKNNLTDLNQQLQRAEASDDQHLMKKLLKEFQEISTKLT